MTTHTEVVETITNSEKEDDLIKNESNDYEETTENNSEETSNPENVSSGQYAIQLLALSEFSQNRVNQFCEMYELSISKINVTTENGLSKVRYGSFDSKEEAKEFHQQLLQKDLEDIFIVQLENN